MDSVKQRPYPQQQEVTRAGKVECVTVQDILLDTGASTTLVWKNLVPDEKLIGGEIAIRCAHGDVLCYPLAAVQNEVWRHSL